MRSALLTLMSPVLLILTAVAAYDIAVFQPHRQQFDEMLAHASVGDQLPNDTFMNATRVVDGDGAITRMVARRVLTEAYPNRTPLLWHLDFALWNLLVAVHLPTGQIDTLYRALAVQGGCDALAMQMFGVPLERLDDERIMKVAVVVRSPQHYLARPDRVNEVIRGMGDSPSGRPL